MKCLAKILVVVLILCLVGGFIFGRDLIGYLRSSAGSVRDAVKNSVPTQFELRRARDLLEEIIPEMHANIRLIAQEEVEIAALKADIERSEESLNNERGRIEQISAMLSQTHLTGYSPRNHRSDKAQLKEDLARRFDGFKQAEIVLAGKHRLLEAREKSYQAALGLLERTRSQKMLLAQKIEALDSQNRLIQTTTVGSRVAFDNSKLAQTEKLIAHIKKRLDVAERILAHESRFVQPIDIDSVSAEELLAEIAAHLAPPVELETVSMAAPTQLVDRVNIPQ